MSTTEDSGSKCSSAPISTFTIQSILGKSSEKPRSGAKESSKGLQLARTRSLSVSSEEECSGGEDSADCFCSVPGHSEPCNQHQPLNFSCLGATKGLISGHDGIARRPRLTQPLLQDYKEEQEIPCNPMSPISEERQADGADKQSNSSKKKTRTVFSRSQVYQLESTFDMKSIMTSEAPLPCSLFLTQFLQQPPRVLGKWIALDNRSYIQNLVDEFFSRVVGTPLPYQELLQKAEALTRHQSCFRVMEDT
ncbi:hypothetical protein J4Q44_G00006440 [Coregonus suidteri]|uniref:Uncharacterized protein n=1 Tax=Coregonus suidteri TaxID=861788 RepID=A0AAN8NIV6_9TELE